MRLLVSVVAALAVSFSAQANELEQVGDVFVKVYKDSVSLVKDMNNALASSSYSVEFWDETSTDDDVLRLTWNGELEPLLEDQDAFVVKFSVQADVSEIDSFSGREILDEVVLASAQVTVKEYVSSLFGVAVEYELGQYVQSENTGVTVADIGGSEHFNIATASVYEEVYDFGDVSVFGFEVGQVTLSAGAKVWVGWSRLNDASTQGLHGSYRAEVGANLYREGNHTVPFTDFQLGNLDLSVSAYTGEEKIGSLDLETQGVDWTVDFANVPGAVQIGYEDQEIEGLGDSSRTTVKWVKTWGGSKSAPAPVPDKKK